MSFGAVYCLVPWLWKRKELYSIALVEWHFWLSALGILLSAAAIWIAGTMQGLMFQSYDKLGSLQYSFAEIIEAIHPYDIIRATGGTLFTLGVLIMVYNLLKPKIEIWMRCQEVSKYCRRPVSRSQADPPARWSSSAEQVYAAVVHLEPTTIMSGRPRRHQI